MAEANNRRRRDPSGRYPQQTHHGRIDAGISAPLGTFDRTTVHANRTTTTDARSYLWTVQLVTNHTTTNYIINQTPDQNAPNGAGRVSAVFQNVSRNGSTSSLPDPEGQNAEPDRIARDILSEVSYTPSVYSRASNSSSTLTNRPPTQHGMESGPESPIHSISGRHDHSQALYEGNEAAVPISTSAATLPIPDSAMDGADFSRTRAVRSHSLHRAVGVLKLRANQIHTFWDNELVGEMAVEIIREMRRIYTVRPDGSSPVAADIREAVREVFRELPPRYRLIKGDIAMARDLMNRPPEPPLCEGVFLSHGRPAPSLYAQQYGHMRERKVKLLFLGNNETCPEALADWLRELPNHRTTGQHITLSDAVVFDTLHRKLCGVDLEIEVIDKKRRWHNARHDPWDTSVFTIMYFKCLDRNDLDAVWEEWDRMSSQRDRRHSRPRWPAAPDVILGLSPSGGAARWPQPAGSVEGARSVSRDECLQRARLSERDGSLMYVECARYNESARDVLFPLLIGNATAWEYFRYTNGHR